ncbi:tail fiber domain-containing protein [Marixanthomonas spongiae]|uniref:Peptidase S74 domain-containing protein n=1 Tax=Marixanthomonas spongiae TaxID=2174845 RepID=A0A2U0I807_9FLAO|nr:tail fiber domain-containing protein [Marixanthomonas spongiae]PVW17204.1 hypothetical protein DDV96_01430 [Marixanthomonas spongiae]
MKPLFFLPLLLLFCFSVNAQVGINNTNPKAMLDVTANNATSPSNTDGILIPRLDALPTNVPTADQNGMLIFLTSASGGFQPGFLYWDQTIPNWVAINTGANTGAGWELEGNKIEDTDFFGTTNNKPVKIYTNNTQQFSFTPDGQLNFTGGIELGNGSTETSGGIAIGKSLLLGGNTKADRYNTIAIGNSSQALQNSAVALGHNSEASGVAAVSIGHLSKAEQKASAFGPESDASGKRAIAIGNKSIASAESAISIGDESIASANNALAFGYKANASGSSALAFGRTAVASATATAIGSSSKASGQSAISIGYSEASGEKSIAIGGQGTIGPGLTGKATASFKNSTAIGTGAKASQTDATAIGRGSNASQTDAIAIGRYTLASEIGSVAIGSEANVYDQYGIAIGFSSEADVSSIGIGRLANAYGDLSVAIGDDSEADTTAVAIGNKANAYGENSIAIGNGASAGTNQIRLGNSNVISIGGYAAFTNISDGRFKYDIHHNVPGLKFIKNLRPITYKLNRKKLSQFKKEHEIASNTEQIETGFIAQEVEALAKKLDYEFNGVKRPDDLTKDNYTLSYSLFVVPLVKAVQEQQQEIEILKNKLSELQSIKAEFDALKKVVLNTQKTDNSKDDLMDATAK